MNENINKRPELPPYYVAPPIYDENGNKIEYGKNGCPKGRDLSEFVCPCNFPKCVYLKDISIIGEPGAAISLPTTMFDVLLPQLFTTERITKEDLIRLGDGGLCQQCKVCHFPNCTFGRY